MPDCRPSEEALLFDCAGEQLVGILARGQQPASTGVLIIVGGPQTRVGSHRQFVLLARALAAAGYAVLRFDYRGMGDSSGAQRTFESVSDDIAAAMTQLHTSVPTVQRVVLWGLCDAASAALLYCHQRPDARVAGLCLLNPWVRSEASLAKTQVKHYYTQRLRQKEFWLKLLSGKVGLDALQGLWHKLRLSAGSAAAVATETLSFQKRMALAWKGLEGKMLLILSGDDYTAKEFLEATASDPAWGGCLARPGLTRQDIADVDHTFSNAAARQQVERITLAWLGSL